MSCKQLVNFAALGARQFSSTSARRAVTKGDVPEGFYKLKEIQAKFQKKDGKPIHLKGGLVDQVLFGTTVILCAVGLAGIGRLIYILSYPRKD